MNPLVLAALVLIAAPAFAGCMQSDGDGETETSSTGPGFRIASSSFQAGEPIPRKHTCDGEEVSPQLTITGSPEETVILALTVKDHDVPTPQAPNRTIVHWVVYDVPVGGAVFPEGGIPIGAREGMNDFGEGWLGPCPPPTSPAHRYNFTAYALDAKVTLPDNATAMQLEQAMAGHVLARTTLIGLYQREVVPTTTPSLP